MKYLFMLLCTLSFNLQAKEIETSNIPININVTCTCEHDGTITYIKDKPCVSACNELKNEYINYSNSEIVY